MNVLVTGASRGIGYELVKTFASDRANHILALSRDMEKLKILKEACAAEYSNTNVMVHGLDFFSTTVKEDLERIVASCNMHFDIVINNAGYLVNQSFMETTLPQVQAMFQVNLFAPMLLIQAIQPYLKEGRECHIVNIGSMGGFQGSVKFPGLSMYSASKAALASLTECLAEEFKETNVRVNCLALGSVQTEMLNEAFPGFEAQTSAQEMAQQIAEFGKTGHHYFNGKVLPVSKNTP